MKCTGVNIKNNKAGCPIGAHVHIEDKHWRVTSDTPITHLEHCDVLVSELPGVLGSYFLPDNCVFNLKSQARTTLSDWRRIQKENMIVQNTPFVHHTTLSLPSGSECKDADEYFEEESVDSDDDDEFDKEAANDDGEDDCFVDDEANDGEEDDEQQDQVEDDDEVEDAHDD